MSKYAVGTIVQHNRIETAKFRLNPRTEGDEQPWEALDVPPLLAQLLGDDNNEVRFTDGIISEDIEKEVLAVIYAP